MLAALSAAFLSPWLDVVTTGSMAVLLMLHAIDTSRELRRHRAHYSRVGFWLTYASMLLSGAASGSFAATCLTLLAHLIHVPA